MGSGRLMLTPNVFSLQSISWKMIPFKISPDGATGTLLLLKLYKNHLWLYVKERKKGEKIRDYKANALIKTHTLVHPKLM